MHGPRVGSTLSGELLTRCFNLVFGLMRRNRRSMLAVSGKSREETRMSAIPHLGEYRLTTAEIIYRLPDHPGLLQSFIWQKLDVAPDFPELRRFLEFWSRNIEGKLHSVRVGQARPSGGSRFRIVDTGYRLH